jgi:CheY-like chemotaxis protein
MPEMDGFELIEKVRGSTNATVRDVRAAALTAYARSEDRAKTLRCGFQLHLSKSVDPAELIAAVGTLARRSS